MVVHRMPLVPDSCWEKTLKKSNRDVALYVLSYVIPPVECISCGGKLLATRRSTRTYRDIPSPPRQVFVQVVVHVYKCQRCRQQFSDEPPGMSTRHLLTSKLESLIASQKESNVKIARRFGIDEKTVRSIKKELTVSSSDAII